MKQTAVASTVTAWKSLSTWRHAVSVASVIVAELQDKFTSYTPTKLGRKKKAKRKKGVTYPKKRMSSPQTYEISECDALPLRSVVCAEGKPTYDHACTLFKTSLGIDQITWQTDADASWKGDVLHEIGAIFSQACPYLPDRIRFVTMVHRILSFYLTSDEYYNLRQPGNQFRAYPNTYS